jgi:broad specificity phosphatase PhoE
MERVRGWIANLGGPSIIVAHGAIGRCLIGLVCNLGPAEVVLTKTPQGRFCRLENGRAMWSGPGPDTSETSFTPLPVEG